MAKKFEISEVSTDVSVINSVKALMSLNLGGKIPDNITVDQFVEIVYRPVDSDTLNMMFGDTDVYASLNKFFYDLVMQSENRKEFITLIKENFDVYRRLEFLTNYFFNFVNACPDESTDDLATTPMGECEYFSILKKDEFITYEILNKLIETLPSEKLPAMWGVISMISANMLEENREEMENDPDGKMIFYSRDILEGINENTSQLYKDQIINRLTSVPFILNGRDVPFDTRYPLDLLFNDDAADVRRKCFAMDLTSYDPKMERRFSLALNANPENILHPANVKYMTPTLIPYRSELKAVLTVRKSSGMLPEEIDIETYPDDFYNRLGDILITKENIDNGIFDEIRYVKSFVHPANVASEETFHNFLREFMPQIIAAGSDLPLLNALMGIEYEDGVTVHEALKDATLFNDIKDGSITKLVAVCKAWLVEHTDLDLSYRGCVYDTHMEDVRRMKEKAGK